MRTRMSDPVFACIFSLALSPAVMAAGLEFGRLNRSTVRCWGYNGSGQLGNGDKINQYSPVQVVPKL